MKTILPAPSHVVDLDPVSFYDRVYGGWLGRVAGCVLGKPVKMGWSISKLDFYLHQAGCMLLTNYILCLESLPAGLLLNEGRHGCCRGEIHGSPPDDDTDYTILGLHILGTYGLNFTTGEVATEWYDHLPYHRTWTTERTAYRNLILGIFLRCAARFFKPGREFIWAHIRVDAYWLALPGNLTLATELARRTTAMAQTFLSNLSIKE